MSACELFDVCVVYWGGMYVLRACMACVTTVGCVSMAYKFHACIQLSVCVPSMGYVCGMHTVWQVGSTCLCEYCDDLNYVCVLPVYVACFSV